ncbi:long-chain fatty acid--CoA ligase [Stutzerimonas azotifigens]|uniref:Long-chain fatty acid--CoA ligase n=1 Tax=Stutzerimonas azotifigens TaxID=291995 RepID=A0ABR5YYJ2_9GAMM|nr:long-chain fatty acid--CoA ligase [Stutzerimonas azotifigens]MBA1273012.1 long-chain fatty acid--CoA ligase [Stutzerimonas azotifigens]
MRFERHYGVWPRQLPKTLSVPQTSLFTNLEISARRFPDKTAIVYYDTRIRYAELLREVEALAGYLQHLGVGRGDRVLLYMQNAPQFTIAYYAILRADAVVVPVNPMNHSAELEHYLADTGAAVCLCGQELTGFIAPLVGQAQLRHVIVTAYREYLRQPTDLALPPELTDESPFTAFEGAIAWQDALAAGHRPSAHLAGPDDHCVFPYSSGTTGAPKGCVHTHRSAMATTVHRLVWNGSTSETVILATLPFFHVTGMQGAMNGPIYLGGTSVVMTRWNRQVAAQLIERYAINAWINIATMAIDFLSDPDIERYDLSSLKSIGGGGAAMPSAVEEKLQRLTGLHYIEGYGLSETIAATHINPAERPKPQCLGIPVFDVDSRIIDVASLEELGPNEVGEIVSHGPQLFEGYWNRPEETAQAFIELDGKRFFRTGDLGYYDQEGYFFMVDRVKRMINASGFKVWPSEVESLMYRHPAIQECCIIATPDPRRGETVKACVVLRPERVGQVGEQDIIDWCRQEMAAYKVPAVVEFRQSLPRSSTGKLMWRALQQEEDARQALRATS